MKRATTYVPDRGDLIWAGLSPTAGHEQAGRRPVLVLSPEPYNRKTGLCVICVATRKRKGYAFEVVLDDTPGQESVVLADHVRTIDWQSRRVQAIRQIDANLLEDVVARLMALIAP